MAIFNFARHAPKLRYYDDVIHSFYCKLAVEHNGAFKMRESVPSPRYSPVCNVLRQWKTSFIPTYRVGIDSMILILILLQWTYRDSVLSSDVRLHVNQIHFLARRAVC